MRLGEFIKQYRIDNNLTMDDFSKKANLTKGYISMLEKNQNPKTKREIVPSFATIQQIATAMSMSASDVISALDDKQPISWGEEKPSDRSAPLHHSQDEYVLTEMLARIKELKKINKITNITLSELTGISIGTLSKILAGMTMDPSISHISKIAKQLGVTLDYLVYGDAAPNKTQIPYDKLNDAGRAKADEYITDLSFNPKYTVQNGAVAGDIAGDILTELKDVAAHQRTPTSTK